MRPPRLLISIKSGTPAESRMRALLALLPDRYDLAGWMYTNVIIVDQAANPHSHPVLTLNTAHERNETMALAEFVHEQLHWFEEARAADRDRAIEATRQPYPTVPSPRPDGAGTETSTRLHLLVCYLEYQALKCLLDPERARATIAAISNHHYRWIYQTVLRDEGIIGEIVRRHDLVPEPLRNGANRPPRRPKPKRRSRCGFSA
jgi:hypothetical protein